ncbi:ABC transporter permease [Bauldia sp.]|uniref:ABC transporter permease n=1 Tax=Bauldia sp. TaxID=2575872 RepID=UPI003BA97989
MPPEPESGATHPDIGDVRIQDVVSIKEQTPLERVLSSQPFWVTVALALIIGIMVIRQPDSFGSAANFANMTRNFAIIGIMAIGMVAVIITGGIDLSVGSIMGVTGVVCGLLLEAGSTWYIAVIAGLLTGVLIGLINGLLIAYAGLSAFVVTLAMMSFARSIAIVLSQNRMIYDFGPHGQAFKDIGGGEFLELSNIFWALVVLSILVGIILKFSTWGRYLYSIGGNEQAARLTGVPVNRVKAQAYILSAVTAAISAILLVGWQGSAINSTGQAYELRVIASTVIGGANLMGGEGGVYGAVIGAALLEVIRNSLLMEGIDSNWQGAFVGVFIVLAVLLEKIRGQRRA